MRRRLNLLDDLLEERRRRRARIDENVLKALERKDAENELDFEIVIVDENDEEIDMG